MDYALSGLHGFPFIEYTGLHPVLIDSALTGLTLIQNKKTMEA
jgi:hypothetical protein